MLKYTQNLYKELRKSSHHSSATPRKSTTKQNKQNIQCFSYRVNPELEQMIFHNKVLVSSMKNGMRCLRKVRDCRGSDFGVGEGLSGCWEIGGRRQSRSNRWSRQNRQSSCGYSYRWGEMESKMKQVVERGQKVQKVEGRESKHINNLNRMQNKINKILNYSTSK